jgi:hypothetical protein
MELKDFTDEQLEAEVKQRRIARHRLYMAFLHGEMFAPLRVLHGEGHGGQLSRIHVNLSDFELYLRSWNGGDGTDPAPEGRELESMDRWEGWTEARVARVIALLNKDDGDVWGWSLFDDFVDPQNEECLMRIVVWTDEQMATLREYAEAHPQKVGDVFAGFAPPAGDIPDHVLQLAGGMRIVFSIELGQPMGPCRHLSVSVDGPGKWPSPEAVGLIGAALGFRPTFGGGRLWQDHENEAVNWVQVRDVT